MFFLNLFSKEKSYHKAIKWLKDNQLPNGGIIINSKNKTAYPEVTGYIIPTLYNWGEKELARDLVLWLIKQQNQDGSFSAPDGTPYTFDTGQVIRGFISALGDIPEVEQPLRKACDWVLTQIKEDGRLSTPATDMWGSIADDRIHIYVLPPLMEAGNRLNEPRYIDAAKKVLNYYKKREDIIDFNTLSHFYAYIIEGLVDLGELSLATEAMKKIGAIQRVDGSIPAYKEKDWICSTGIAQFCVIWYKMGRKDLADKSLKYLEKIQNKDGGFYGSYGNQADYFKDTEISWAVKYFLDAYMLKIKATFNEEVDIFSDSIDENDGRVKELLSFTNDLNGKKIIDVGCGKGRFARILKQKYPNVELYGLDISENMLRYCPEGMHTLCGNILDIRYPEEYFDYVYCIESLEHAVMIENAIREVVRILKPGGKILIVDKNKAKLGKLKLEPWEQWFSPKEIIDILNRYGVEAKYKLISYDRNNKPDGLFIAWEGVKNRIVR